MTGMKLDKLSEKEIELISKLASEMFDKFDKDATEKLNVKQAFILGMLHGREHALNEVGMYDDEDDDSSVYDFIKKYNK